MVTIVMDMITISPERANLSRNSTFWILGVMTVVVTGTDTCVLPRPHSDSTRIKSADREVFALYNLLLDIVQLPTVLIGNKKALAL